MEYFPKPEEKFLISAWPCNILCKYNIVTVVIIINRYYYYHCLRFENVMILNAPEWSPASVQFTHGFPRRLVQAAHGGFLPGNVIVTARASNMSLRRMAVCDIASLVSQISIANSGLSCGRLLNLR